MPKKPTAFRALRHLIDDQDYLLADVAKEIKRCDAYLSARICGKQPFNADEITRICLMLGIRQEEIGKYFFPDVPKRSPL